MKISKFSKTQICNTLRKQEAGVITGALLNGRMLKHQSTGRSTINTESA